MPVTFCFTLDPLRSWRMYRLQAKKAQQLEGYLEQALDPSTASDSHESAIAPLAALPLLTTATTTQRARVQVVGDSAATSERTTPASAEQVALAARMRQDVVLLSPTPREPDDESNAR